MHHASLLRLPAGAIPPLRPVRRPAAGGRVPDASLGIWSRAALLELGMSDRGIEHRVREGRLLRVAHGLLAEPSADQDAVRALRLGGRLTCIDAARKLGLWVPARGGDRQVHLYRPRASASVPPWVRLHGPWVRAWPEPDLVASAALALGHALRCCDAETAAILLESAMNRGVLPPQGVEDLLAASPVAVRRPLGALSTASDSGSETRVVRWLRRRGFRVEQQVWVQGAGYVDAYVGGIFLEIDGRLHHSTPEAFESDRRRDLTLRRLGLQVLRLSYGQVWHSWPATQRALLEVIDAGRTAGRRAAERAGITA